MGATRQCVWLIIFSLLLHLAGYLMLFKKMEPFLYFFYLTSWWSYIFFIDALVAIKTKRLLILNRHLPFLIIVSCGFWCIFEIMNIGLKNWFYINLPAEVYYRYTGYFFAYGTVIPAIYITKTFSQPLFEKIKTKPFRIKHYPFYSISLGIMFLFLICLFPDHLFPLTWIFLALILDGCNYQRGYTSFMKDFTDGNPGNFLAAMFSGLICGLLWEAWNFLSISKWIYSVPFFEDLKIFEMPIPGYTGFLVFGLETVAFVNFLVGIRSSRRLFSFVAVIAFVFSIITFTLIDRYTVFSYAPEIEDIDFIGKEKLNYLKMAGVRTSFGINANLLSLQEREDMKLLHLKGLGLQKYLKLKGQGIKNIDDLSKLDDSALSKILDEENMRRVRVYLKAAKKAVSVERLQ